MLLVGGRSLEGLGLSDERKEQSRSVAASNAPVKRSLLGRIVRAQEFGLVVVIIALMVGLTTYTHLRYGPVPRFDQIKLAEGSVLAPQADQRDGEIAIKAPDGKVTRYKEADGYELRGSEEKPIVRYNYGVNKFLNSDNLISVLTSTSFIAVMAVGMTAIIALGGIDLSIGSIYALAAVIGAMVLQGFAGSDGSGAGLMVALPIAVLACCGIGAACGFVNGAASVGLNVHPFIITLGGMAIYRGIAFVSTQGQTISGPESLQGGMFKAELWGITPVPSMIMVVIALAGMFVFANMVFGRRIFAIGGNEIAAKYAGIPVGRVKIICYTLMGALTGLSALMYLGYYGAASSDAGKGYELSVIAAAVVGGASLSGGRGSALGAVLGAITIQLIDNSILMTGIRQEYKDIVIGLAIIVAVVVDQAKHRLGSKKH